MLEQMPVQAPFVTPLSPLTKFSAHEQKLLPGLGIHVAVKESEIRKFLPVVARHLRQERALSVYDFILALSHDEVLRPGVDHAERELLVMESPVDRILG